MSSSLFPRRSQDLRCEFPAGHRRGDRRGPLLWVPRRRATVRSTVSRAAKDVICFEDLSLRSLRRLLAIEPSLPADRRQTTSWAPSWQVKPARQGFEEEAAEIIRGDGLRPLSAPVSAMGNNKMP